MPVGVLQSLTLTAFDGEQTENIEPSGFSDPALIPWYKAVGTSVVVIFLFFSAWYLFYPLMLQKGKVWPVTLFGYCTCAAWMISWCIGLFLYWDSLPFSHPTDGPQPFEREWGLRLACISVAAVFGVLSLVYWRSDAQTRSS